MEANGHNSNSDAEKLRIQSDLNTLSISKDEEEEEKVSDDSIDSPPGGFNDASGFEDPKIARLIEGAMESILKLLENLADTLEQKMKGNADSFNSLKDNWDSSGDEEEFREFLKSFADLLKQEKKSRRDFSNLVGQLIATDPDSNRHLSFFVGSLYDMKHEKGVSELSDALESYL